MLMGGWRERSGEFETLTANNSYQPYDLTPLHLAIGIVSEDL